MSSDWLEKGQLGCKLYTNFFFVCIADRVGLKVLIKVTLKAGR